VTAPTLRPFQVELKSKVYRAWQEGARNVVMRLDTGGGKTVTLADIVREHGGFVCVIAHRQELVGQLSMALARYGIRHNIIAADATRRAISRQHSEALGYSMYDPNSRVVVAGVDTIIRAEMASWAAKVTLWVVDEGHHVVLDNKWHTVIERFSNPECRGLLPTATPVRADGQGLGRPEIGGRGVADVMVEGPPMRWLIDEGYLTDYRIFCPPSDMQLLANVSASGDWSSKALREAAKRSQIVGDVATHYARVAGGRRGVTFAPDLETAAEMAAAHRAAGFRAEVLSGKTDDFVRRSVLKRLEAGEVHQVVAVDIISEGFDLPAIEVLSKARATASLAVYMQQFGRALRPVYAGGFDLSTREGRLAAIAAGPKPRAIIIDHVGNVVRHNGPPDFPRVWSLESRKSRNAPSDAIPIRVCTACFEPYQAIKRECPHCGHYEPPAGRDSPAMVAGDLQELDPAVLAALRVKLAKVDQSREERGAEMQLAGVPHAGYIRNLNSHSDRQEAQAALRSIMAIWGGVQTAAGYSDPEIQRLFFFRFGVDVMTAQTLDAADARDLQGRIAGAL
jgi:superfamily II DNA or RNA helicase